MELVEQNKITNIGSIPKDWKVKELGEVLSIRHGKNQKDVEDKNGKYPILGTGGIMGYANDYLYDKESVLIGRKGTIDKPRYMNSPFWTVDTLFYSEINPNFSAKLLFYNFQLIDWYSHNEASGVPSLNAGKIEKIKIALAPTLEEQIKIASVISDIESLIESLEKLISKKIAIKQGAMQQLLTPPDKGGKRLDGYSEDWSEVTLGEVGDCIIGLTYTPSDVSDTGTLVLRSSNIQDDKLSFLDTVYVSCDIPEKLRTQLGDILVCVRNGSRRLIGKCAKIDERCVGQSFGAFMSMYRSPLNDFISHAFKSYSIQKQIEENLGATINQITNKTLNSFKIWVPNDENERIEISTILDDMDKEIDSLLAKKAKYQDMKLGMMQELLTGKTRLV